MFSMKTLFSSSRWHCGMNFNFVKCICFVRLVCMRAKYFCFFAHFCVSVFFYHAASWTTLKTILSEMSTLQQRLVAHSISLCFRSLLPFWFNFSSIRFMRQIYTLVGNFDSITMLVRKSRSSNIALQWIRCDYQRRVG